MNMKTIKAVEDSQRQEEEREEQFFCNSERKNIKNSEKRMRKGNLMEAE